MPELLTDCAATFNLRHRGSGHSFQNRRKSILCQEDAYLLELVGGVLVRSLGGWTSNSLALIGVSIAELLPWQKFP